jgi:hypothetical protein
MRSSATAPSYFKVGSIEVLAVCMAQCRVGGAELPFYYYHIPRSDGCGAGHGELPASGGGADTQPGRHEVQRADGLRVPACLELDGGRFDCVWVCDEMLLSALTAGAKGAIVQTYNIAAPLYRRLMEAFERRDLVEAGRIQSLSIRWSARSNRCQFHPAMKQLLAMAGSRLWAMPPASASRRKRAGRAIADATSMRLDSSSGPGPPEENAISKSRGEPSVSANRCLVLWALLALLSGASACAGEMLRWEALACNARTP